MLQCQVFVLEMKRVITEYDVQWYDFVPQMRHLFQYLFKIELSERNQSNQACNLDKKYNPTWMQYFFFVYFKYIF